MKFLIIFIISTFFTAIALAKQHDEEQRLKRSFAANADQFIKDAQRECMDEANVSLETVNTIAENRNFPHGENLQTYALCVMQKLNFINANGINDDLYSSKYLLDVPPPQRWIKPCIDEAHSTTGNIEYKAWTLMACLLKSPAIISAKM